MNACLANYEKYIFLPKRNNYACIIPVLNEEERFHSQMKKMKEAGVFELCDVFICDGNSIDDSSNPEIVKSYGVRGLIIKKDEKKRGQAVQLKIGFYETMQEKYDGVIMVDGNDKDNIANTLPLFLDALDQGFDLVQGTRYRKGGQGINTPILRELAIKFVASPIVSLGAKHWYSDPCNGYKAFSRKFILDPKMNWFSDFYQGYEYCYYPLVQAKHLGYKIIEIPVVRAYPKDSLPSKITSLSHHFNLLKLIFVLSFSKKV